MTTKVPQTGSAALTYDKSADIGVFDGRVIAPQKPRRTAAGVTTAPNKPPTKPKTGEPTTHKPQRATGQSDRTPSEEDPQAPRKKGFLLPLVAGLVLIVIGAGVVVHSLLTVVASDRAAERAQDDLTAQFAERQSLAASGLLADAFDPDAVNVESEPVVETDFDTQEDIPIIFGAPSGGAPVVNDPTTLPGWQFEAAPPKGEALGRIIIPTAGIDWVVVQGVNPNDLRKGPGHMPGTSMPGQYGNAVLSGHRTTYGAPFGNLDRMAPGDEFTVETLIGTHTYRVVSVEIVKPTDTWVVQPMEGGWLTLITCHPKYTSQQRMIVFSKLVAGPNADAVAQVYGTAYDPPRAPLPFESTPTTAG